MRSSSSLVSTTLLALMLVPAYASAQEEVDLGPPFGTVRLVDEVSCADGSDPHPFRESPSGASRIETVLGRSARVMPSAGGARYFAYRVGAGQVVPGRAYVLSVTYPEDAPRTLFIANRGGEQIRGLSTGVTVGDSVGGYTNNALESVDYPLSGRWEEHRTLFFMHHRFAGLELARGADTRPDDPASGFWVIVAQLQASDAPLSAGAAVSHIRLYEVPDPERIYATIHYPPDPLPRRFIFWREEMSDNIIGDRDGNVIGTGDRLAWFEYKARLMRFLGINTFSKDLLEFGHNQGWDSSRYGGNRWVYQSSYPTLWSDILTMIAGYGHYVMPYYEYAGSRGGEDALGTRVLAEPLGRPPFSSALGRCSGYTHIGWSENANVDVTDPATFEDLRRMLEITLVDFRDTVPFAGAWIRNRVSDFPIGFGDATRARFADEANGGAAVSRADLSGDAALRARYVQWFHQKRVAFLEQVSDYLRDAVGDELSVLYTPYHEEAGPGVGGGVVADDPARFASTSVGAQPWADFVSRDSYLDTLLTPHVNWRDGDCAVYEWQHGNPPLDLETYQRSSILPTYPFHRLFTTQASSMEAFRSDAGLALVRHYTLNEHRIPDELLGYFVSDVDRAGPYSMLAEARGLAHGDPRYLGYLVSHTFNRGFPEYARAFNLAFLALPAIPSERVDGAASDPEVVLRVYPTEAHGTFAAVVHTGLRAVADVRVTLPASGQVTDRVSGEVLPSVGGVITVSLYPGQVLALHVDGAAPSLGDAGVPRSDGGASAPRDGATAQPDGGVDAPPAAAGGCGCRSTGGSTGGGLALWLAALAVVVARRRRC